MRKIVFLLASLLIVCVLFVQTVSASFNTENNSVNFAKQSAQVFIDRVVDNNTALLAWAKAKMNLSSVFRVIDSSNNVYMFSIVNNGSILGHILVGDSVYNYKVLQAGTSAPPNIPTVNEVVDSIDRLEIQTEDSAIGLPEEYIYTGVDGMYAIYTIAGKRFAVNILTKDALLLYDLKFNMGIPLESTSLNSKVMDTNLEVTLDGSSGYNYLNMSAYTGGYCGPCSGVSIGAYYRDSVGYDNFSHTNDWFITSGDYWTVVDDIDSGSPVTLCITSQRHWRAIKGYDWEEPDPWEGDPYYYIICTNSQTGDSWEYLDWNNLGMGLFTCCIED